MSRLAVLAMFSLIAGCASPTYVAADRDQFRRDSYECSRDSRTYGGGSGIIGALMIINAQNQAQAMYEKCMESKGYIRN